MNKTLTFIPLFIFCSALTAQTVNLSGWKSTDLEKANTAIEAEYLSEKEKKIIFYTNLARLNGSLFYETLAEPYIKSLTKKPAAKYTTTLKSDLMKSNGLTMLTPKQDLFAEAYSHSTDMGKSGKTGHNTSRGASFTKRYKSFLKTYMLVGENCHYGSNDAFEIVMDLLIDENVVGYGHRKNMLNPAYQYIGVSIQSHKVYHWNTVMSLGGRLRAEK